MIILVKVIMVTKDSDVKPNAVTVKLNLDGDFPNPKEGTAIFDMKLLMDNIINVNQMVPKYVMFAESKTVPGLIFRYNVHDSKFEGGLPIMQSSEVKFLDGNKHQVAYSFKVGGKQQIFFDGQEIASGDFDASKMQLTGLAVADINSMPSIPFDGDVWFK